jgi:putative MATE family efflux protein
MRVLIIGNFINMILDPFLIFGIGPFPELGIKGAAIATTTGRGIAVLIQLYYLFSGKRRIIIIREHMKFNWPVLKSILRLSGGGTLQSLIATSSWVAMVRIISHFGSEAVAGYTIAIRIIIFMLLPSWGLSNAAATLVGQNLGAGKPERAEKSAWITGAINMIFLGIVGLFLIAFPGKFISFFIDNQHVIAEGSICLRMISFGFVFYGLSMVMMQSINGAGDTNTPMMINFFCFWIIEVPLAYILAIKAGMDENGVYTAILVAEALISIISFLIFRKGKWKLNKV